MLQHSQRTQKLKTGCFADDLLLIPAISNAGTASYQLDKYLENLLSPLSKSQYTVNSTKEFIDIMQNERVPTA